MTAPLKLRAYQTEAIDAVFAAWKDAIRKPALVLPTGAGKGHPLTTTVPTPTGPRAFGDLAVGDAVYGSDGTPTTVTAVFDRGVLPTFHVAFADGAAVDCDGDHLWTIRYGTAWRTVSTAWLAGHEDLAAYWFRIPAAGWSPLTPDPNRAVVSVTPTLPQPIRCITVAADDHLYQITEDRIVTHNTVVMSALVNRYTAEHGKRALILVHREELADQTLDKLRQVAPHLRAGKIKAAHDDIHAPVMVASIQTLSREARLQRVLAAAKPGRSEIGLVLTDECHMALAPSYARVYDAFPGAHQLGVTATLARGDKKGLGSVWDQVVYEKTLPWMIKQGFLVPPRGISVKVDDLDLSGVKKTGGDYQTGDLGRAVGESSLPDTVARAYTAHAADRPGVVFAPTVDTAHQIAEALNGARVRTEVISGVTSTAERTAIYARFRSGATQVLSNCMVLTTGWDAPWASCAVIARPTRSNTLYTQAVGRVLRTWPGKTDALVLDMVGASVDNKLMRLVDLDPGLFEQAGPCQVCAGTPCSCPCSGCGLPRPCACPVRAVEGPRLVGDGSSIDLFAGSVQAWLTTPKGAMFIPVGDGEVFLWASSEPGTWDVCYAPKSGPWQRLHTGLGVGSAMAWAESEADERMPFNTRKTAAWRNKKPSQPQADFARRLGIGGVEGMRSGVLGDAISLTLATRKFDGYLGAPR